MTEDTEKIIRTLRAQAWERAKGELRSMLYTFWQIPSDGDKFDRLDTLIKTLINEVEDNELNC